MNGRPEKNVNILSGLAVFGREREREIQEVSLR